MKKILLFSILVFGSLSLLKAQQTPTISMVEAHDTGYYRAVMTAVVSDKAGWTINGVGFIWDTLAMPTRATGAKIKQAASSCTVNENFSTFQNAASQYMASGKTYYVRAYAKKGAGTNTDTVFSSPISVNIPVAIPPVFKVDTISNITLNSATFNGYIEDKNDASSIAKKGVVYSNIYAMPTLHQGTAIYNNTSTTTFPNTWDNNVMGLQSGTTYYVRAFLILKYMNTGLDTIYSDTISFKTLRACGMAPYNVEVSNIGVTTAKIKFIPGPGQVKWHIDYDFAGHTPGVGTADTIESDSTTINNLKGGKSYSVFVRAMCDGEYSDWSIIQTFTTLAPPCAEVSTISVAELRPTSVELTWQPGAMTQNKWEVCFAKKTAGYPESGTVVENNPVFSPIGLTPVTPYKIKVRALCVDSTGANIYSEWSDDYIFNTLPASLEDADGQIVQRVSIYPNPTDGTIYFKAEDAQKVTEIEIYNSMGEKIYSANTLPKSYTLEKQTKGMFLVKIFIGNSVQIEKVILN